MQALNEISKILQAIGAKPEMISNDKIKINAPQIGNEGTNEKSKN